MKVGIGTTILLLAGLGSSSAFAADALDALMQKYGAPAPEAKPAARDIASSTRAKPAKIKKPVKPKVEHEAPKNVAAPVEAPAPVAAAPAVEEEEKVEYGLLGDWAGLKPKMKNAGVELALAYKGDTMRTMSGGLKRGTVFLGNVDLTADLDFEKIAGLKGLSLSLYGLGDHGGKPSEYAGNGQGVDNIEAAATFKLYEAYLKQELDDRFLILLGLRDLNADYYSTESSKLFLSPTFGTGTSMAQTGPNGPSIFPNAALALNVKYESPSSLYFQAGVFDAQAGDPAKRYGTQITHNIDEGQLIASELGWSKSENDVPCKLALGAWMYSKAQAAVDSTKDDAQNWGFYLLLDHQLAPKLSGFVRHGIASPVVNKFASSTEVGLTYKGLIPAREDDVIGLAAGRVVLSDDNKVLNNLMADETVVELLYRAEVVQGISAQPDLQYVFHPGSTEGVKNALVGALRIEIEF